jgi:outer membrane immunogenic protein
MRKLGPAVSAFLLSSALLISPAASDSGYSWTGFYVGGSLGGAISSSDRSALGCGDVSGIVSTSNTTGSPDTCEAFGPEFDGNVTDGPSTGSVFPSFEFPVGDWIARKGTSISEESGFLYGGHFGVNQQSGSQVVGIEIDISGTSDVEESAVAKLEHFGTENGGDLSEYLGEISFGVRDEMEWLSTIRARVGEVVSADGRFLAYLTGGLAIARVQRTVQTGYDETGKNANGNAKCNPNLPECLFTAASGGKTFYQKGFVVGAGGEWAITDQIIVGAQYLYTDLDGGEKSTATYTGDNDRSMDLEIDGGFDVLHSLQARVSVKLN